jgi:hypothetical protein
LFLGTQAENVADMVKKGRRRGGDVSGEKNPQSRLTWKDVDEIRRRYVPRRVTLRQLADEYGVSETTVSLVVNGKIWRAKKLGGGWTEEMFA